MSADREEELDAASLRLDLGRSLLIGAALSIAKTGTLTENMLASLREYAQAYEQAKYEHRELLFGAKR